VLETKGDNFGVPTPRVMCCRVPTAVPNFLPRHVHVDAVGKSDGHHGQAGDRLGAQGRKSGGPIHGVLDLFL